MKQHTPTLGRHDKTVLRCLLFGGLAVMAISPFYGFISTWLGTSVGPLLVWKAARDLVILLLFAVLLGWVLAGWRQRRILLADTVMRLLFVYAVIALLVSWWHYEGVTRPLLAGILFDFRYVMLYVVMYSAQYFLGGVPWRQPAKRVLMTTGLLLVALGLLQVTVMPADFLTQFGYSNQTIAPVSTIDANPDARRAFATMSGPNDYGAFMVVLLLVAVVGIRSFRQRWLAVTAMGAGLFISGSRSAWLGAAAAVAVVCALNTDRSLYRSRRFILAVFGAIVAMGAVVALALVVPQVRLAVFHSSPGDTHLTEGSTDLHWQHTATGIRRVIEQPLGCGLGCAGPASFYDETAHISENYYVQIAEETGIIGLIAWVGVYAVVLWRLYMGRRDVWAVALFASGIGLGLVGFWLHVWADDAVSLVWWGLSGLVLGQIAGQTQPKAVSLQAVHGKKENKKQISAAD